MSSGRKVSKIKTAGDMTVDHEIAAGKFEYMEVTAQTAGVGDGKGAILMGGADINASFVYDVDRKVFDINDLQKPSANTDVWDDGNFIFTPEKISNDGGATWVEPRVAGGRWVLGLQSSSAALKPYLFEHRPGSGLAYINQTTLAVISTHTQQFMDVNFEENNFAAVAVFGSAGISNYGFCLCLGLKRFYVQTEFSIDTALSITSATFEVVTGDIIIGNTNNNDNTGYYSVFRIKSDETIWRHGFSSPGSGPSDSQFDIWSDSVNKAKYLKAIIGNDAHCGVAFFGLTENSNGATWAYFSAANIYGNYYYSALTATTYGVGNNLSSEIILAVQLKDVEHYEVATESENLYFTSTNTFDATVIRTPYPVTDTNEVALFDTFGFSGEEYTVTSEIGGEDWLGNTIAPVPVIKAESGIYEKSTIGDITANTQLLINIKIPETTTDFTPTIVSGILGKSEDKITVVSDIKMNLSITGVE